VYFKNAPSLLSISSEEVVSFKTLAPKSEFVPPPVNFSFDAIVSGKYGFKLYIQAKNVLKTFFLTRRSLLSQISKEKIQIKNL